MASSAAFWFSFREHPTVKVFVIFTTIEVIVTVFARANYPRN